MPEKRADAAADDAAGRPERRGRRPVPPDLTGRPHEGLRVGPWLAEDRPDPLSDQPAVDPSADQPRMGPSWTAPTVALLPSELGRPAAAGPATHGGTDPAGPALGGGTDAAGPPAGPAWRSAHVRRHLARPDRSAPARVRGHSWLFAAGALALVVLCCSRTMLSGPDPTWSLPPAATPSLGPPPDTATPAPVVSPTPSPTATPRRGQARPVRKPATSRPRTTSPPAPVVQLGPDNAWELWWMLARYCAAAHDSRQPRLRSGTSPAEDNWECRRRGSGVLIDMGAACRHRYGANAFARHSDGDNAFSWRCYRR